MARNELGRYLEPCIAHLQDFCDAIAVMDDGSTDGTREWLAEQERVKVIANPGRPMFEHEGQARNALLAFTLKQRPSHVLSIDADEMATEGAAVRAACDLDDGNGAFALTLEEIWK